MIQYNESDQLGEGGFGKVYAGTFKKDASGKVIKSAVKVMPVDSFDKKEFNIHASLSSLPKCDEHVACLYSMKRVGDDVLIAMEYLDGGDLHHYILSRKTPLGKDELFDMFDQIIEGLRFIHSHGVAHLDVKPENIMVTKDKVPYFKFIDFGFACLKTECFDSSMNYATPYLNPPEYYNNHIPPGSAQSADVWALGSMLLEVLLLNEDHTATLENAGLDGFSLRDQDRNWSVLDEPATKKLPQSLVKQIARMMRIYPADRVL